MRLDQTPEARPTTASTEIGPTGSEKRLRPAEARAGNTAVTADVPFFRWSDIDPDGTWISALTTQFPV
jgi:hypothetical protein